MSVKGYRFVSPGIFLREIDESVLTPTRPERGPAIMGRFQRGPAMRPVTVTSYSDFVKIFGPPHPGGSSTDSWRGDAHGGPTYGAYAVEAWLQSGVAPATVFRLLGTQDQSATTAGKAGWDTKNSSGTSRTHVVPTTDNASAYSTNGGAYGLFIVASGSGDGSTSTTPSGTPFNSHYTGSLAAVWYLTEGAIYLKGPAINPAMTEISGAAGLVKSRSNDGDNPCTFTAVIADSAGATTEHVFDFTQGDTGRHIRDSGVFNMDPTATNGTTEASADRQTYWLGETYEQQIQELVTEVSGNAGYQMGIILGLGNSNAEWQQHREGYADGKTGWYIAQDTGTPTDYNALTAQKLFRFHGRGHGEWLQNNMKISIENLKKSNNTKYQYGTFDVVLRHLGSPDSPESAVETFSGCSLDPNSENYIAKKIGDKYIQWDAVNTRVREYGTYDNMSEYIRIEMNESVKRGSAAPELLPFGVFGPPRFKGFSLRHNADGIRDLGNSAAFANAFVEASGAIPNVMTDVNGFDNVLIQGSGHSGNPSDVPRAGQPEVAIGNNDTNYGFRFPAPRLVAKGNAYGTTDHHSHMGVEWSKLTSDSDDTPTLQLQSSIVDAVRRLPAYYAAYEDDPYANDMEYAWVFTLDDVQLDYNAGISSNSVTQPKAYYVSGSRQSSADSTKLTARPALSGKSWTAVSGAFHTGSLGLIDLGYGQFTTLFHGGHDGLDIQEREPFRNTYLDDASADRTANYGYNTVLRAIETLSDPEYVEYNILSMPGLTERTLTKKMITTCSDRADALAVIDVEGGYVPYTESSDTEVNRRGTVTSIVSKLKDRELDNSYGCAYYPWVQVRDNRTGQRLWAPPSVVGVGVMGGSQSKAEHWFAPAGFVRGGLTSQGNRPGAAGLKVLNVRERLSSSDRDDLYEQSVNPIAKFPSEGLVVFGQKTLQLVPSALDRINVRRLLLYVKKEISLIAHTTLFGQNVQTTWDSFKSRAETFLADVQSRFGLTDFLVKLDETTTTDDLIDRNILYAQIYLKPARAIEFIAIDFIITKSGASFDD